MTPKTELELRKLELDIQDRTSTLACRERELELRKLELEVRDKEFDEQNRLGSGVRTGKFMLTGSISESTVSGTIGVIEGYCVFQRMQKRPINLDLTIDTGGGSVTDGLHLVDYLHQLRAEGANVTITAMGEAQSMGAIILQAATTRRMSPRAILMVHEISGSFRGNTSQWNDMKGLMELLEDHCDSLLCSRSTLTRKSLSAMRERKDVYFSAQKALKLKLIDEIVPEDGMTVYGGSSDAVSTPAP